MPRFGPISRRDLIRFFHQLGFEGPFSGSRHQFMRKGALDVHIPNPHAGDVGPKLLGQILREAGVSREEWEVL